MKKVSKKSKVSKRNEELLALLHVLKSIEPNQRVIVMAHMDNKTKDGIYKTITRVLKSGKVPIDERILLKKELGPYKKEFRYLSDKKKSVRPKTKKLTQVGGGPMTPILKLAIPLLLDLFPK